jgi:hypothetical protein
MKCAESLFFLIPYNTEIIRKSVSLDNGNFSLIGNIFKDWDKISIFAIGQ